MRRHWREASAAWRALALAALAALAGCGQYVSYPDGGGPDSASTAAPREEIPEAERLNHYALAGLMATFTSTSESGGDVYVDYVGLSQDPEALHVLEAYLETLAAVDPAGLRTREGRLAYWVNAYNAGVIRGVIERFDGDMDFSVIDAPGFFSDRSIRLGGVLLSLDQVELGVVRGDFERDDLLRGLTPQQVALARAWHEGLWEGGRVDARLHAAFNCGALGCPNLLAEPPYVYRGELLEAQLAAATRHWLAHATKGAGADGVSMLFTWYREDFVNHSGSVEAFIEAHREGGVEGVDTSAQLPYDWALNTRP